MLNCCILGGFEFHKLTKKRQIWNLFQLTSYRIQLCTKKPTEGEIIFIDIIAHGAVWMIDRVMGNSFIIALVAFMLTEISKIKYYFIVHLIKLARIYYIGMCRFQLTRVILTGHMLIGSE